jgi:hypothetical protein
MDERSYARKLRHSVDGTEALEKSDGSQGTGGGF